jgi:hypothetical protein
MRKNGLVITDAPDTRRKVFDHNGHHVGTVGPHAGAPTASRFTGTRDMKLVRGAWRANKPSRPANVSAVPLAKSRATAKGSVGLTLAETSARGATNAKVGGQS